jgi:hypothetical protein
MMLVGVVNNLLWFRSFMPRGKQFGYIFLSGISKNEAGHVIAHELGHGLWKLKHTFDDSYGKTAAATEGTTDNLMDYNKGAHLAKWQWDVMREPAIFDGVFDSDEEGMMAAIKNENILFRNGQFNQSAALLSSDAGKALLSTTVIQDFFTKLANSQNVNTLLCMHGGYGNAAIGIYFLVSREVMKKGKKETIVETKSIEDLTESEFKSSTICFKMTHQPRLLNKGIMYNTNDHEFAHELLIHGLLDLDELNKIDMNLPFETVKGKIIQIQDQSSYTINGENWPGEKDHYQFIIGQKKEMTNYTLERMSQISDVKYRIRYIAHYVDELFKYINESSVVNPNGGRSVVLPKVKKHLLEDFKQYYDLIFKPIPESMELDDTFDYFFNKNESLWDHMVKKTK